MPNTEGDRTPGRSTRSHVHVRRTHRMVRVVKEAGMTAYEHKVLNIIERRKRKTI